MTGAQCEVLPGNGSVARRGDSVLWASAQTPDRVWAALLSCLELVLDLGANPGPSDDDGAGLVLRAVGDAVGRLGTPDTAFVALLSDGRRGRALVHGEVALSVSGQAVSDGPLTDVLDLTGGASGGASGSTGDGEPSPRHDLVAGVVPGAGFRWSPAPDPGDTAHALIPAGAWPEPARTVEPEPAAAEPQTDEPAATEFQQAVSQTGEPQTEDHPVIDDLTQAHVELPADNAEDTTPGANAGDTAPPIPAAGPVDAAGSASGTDAARVSGTLVFEDGNVTTINSDLVLGRRPERHAMVASGEATPLMIADPEHVLSGAHAAIQVSGGDVYVLDLDSLNGTHVAAPDARDWTKLEPGSPYPLTDGYRLLLGWTVLTFRNDSS